MYKEKTFCDLPFNKIKLWPDGNITNCCNQEKNSIGNIFEKSFEKIWFEGVINEIREHTKNKKLHKICKKFNCPFKYTLRELKDFNFELYPTHLEIDIPDSQCNIGGEDPLKTGGACLMCKRNSKFYQKEEDRLYEALEKIKYLIKYLTFIHIQGIAEPFWKDHIYNILEVLNYKYYKNKITISSLTNGILLNEKNNKKILNPIKHHSGYLFVNINKKKYVIHRLVAILFIDNPLNKKEVNHKNGIKSDNNISNLEWVTASENSKHAYYLKLRKSIDEHKKKIVLNIDNGIYYESAKEAALSIGLSHSYVRSMLNGYRKNKTNLKYAWQ